MAKTRSWKTIVRTVDPPDEDSEKPVVYIFSNNRKFRDKRDPYLPLPEDD